MKFLGEMIFSIGIDFKTPIILVPLMNHHDDESCR